METRWRNVILPTMEREIEIDPATGAILRLSVVPEMAANDGMKAAIEVEYASVRIGDLSYTGRRWVEPRATRLRAGGL